MSRWKVSAHLVLALGLVLTLGLAAQAQECRATCTSTTQCSQSCYVDTAAQSQVWMTCGSGNWPCARPATPPPCNSVWVKVNPQPAGWVNYNDYTSHQCNTFKATKFTWHDQNGCSPDRTDCDYQLSGVLLGCCTEGCSPQSFDYTSCRR
jgi:hypothetical protein